MEKLPATYSKYGYEYTQVRRDDSIAVYSFRDEDSKRDLGFEVFRIKHQKETVMPGGGVIPEKEAVPSASLWGQYGYTVRTMDQAEDKIKILKTVRKNKD